ncbi:hypothetical protein [Streptomyces sp. NPDC051576]
MGLVPVQRGRGRGERLHCLQDLQDLQDLHAFEAVRAWAASSLCGRS